MKTRLLAIIGIFLMIFGIDGILFLDSVIPECKGFVGMGWFVFITLGFNPMAILSNPECLTSFYAQTFSGSLFVIGIVLMAYFMIKRQKLGGIFVENEN